MMNINDFEKWLEQIEKDNTLKNVDIPDKKQLNKLLHDKISDPTDSLSLDILSEEGVNVDKILTSFDPEKLYPTSKSGKEKKHPSFSLHFPPQKVAIVIGICLLFINLSAIAYATVAKYYGVHRATPELESLVDSPNETQMLLDRPLQESIQAIQDKYTNTVLLNEASFDDPFFYNVVTDVTLTENSNNNYIAEDFIFNSFDIAAFKKGNDESWYLTQGEKVNITLSIDTSFAACGPEGESIEAAYILNGKYVPFATQKIKNTPTVLSFTAPETGEYYFAITNMSLSYIKITELKVE